MKVMQAEQDKTRSERTHEEKSKLYQECEQQRVSLQRSLKRSISKSKYEENLKRIKFKISVFRPYFDAKEQADYDLQVIQRIIYSFFDNILLYFKNQKLRIEAVQKAISQAKKMYRTALNNLERISEEVR